METLIQTLRNEICDKLCDAARKKSKEAGIDISFAVSDENGLPRVYRIYGEALVLSITLVPGKAYTAAVTQCRTKDVASAAAEGASLMAIQAGHLTFQKLNYINGRLSLRHRAPQPACVSTPVCPESHLAPFIKYAFNLSPYRYGSFPLTIPYGVKYKLSNF